MVYKFIYLISVRFLPLPNLGLSQVDIVQCKVPDLALQLAMLLSSIYIYAIYYYHVTRSTTFGSRS